jgi:hypothetical protein
MKKISKYVRHEIIKTIWDELNEILIVDIKGWDGRQCVSYVHGWGGDVEVELPFRSQVAGTKLPEVLADTLLRGTSKAILSWRKTVPQNLIEHATDLPNSNFEILRLAAHHRVALDLLAGNPVLLWLVYNHCLVNSIGIDEMLGELAVSQSAILAWVGYDGIKSNVKILQKLKGTRVSAAGIFNTLSALRVPSHQKYFRHAKDPCTVEASIISLYPKLLSTPASKLIPLLRDKSLYAKFFELHRFMVEPNRIYRCSTIAQLERVYEEEKQAHLERSYEIEMRRRMEEVSKERIRYEFPPPPIPETDLIEAIRSDDALNQEGIDMEHCIASYALKIATGSYYAYRMHCPVRATIGIRIDLEGTASIDQIRSECDAECNADTYMAAYQWLNSAARQNPAGAAT